MLTKKKIFLKSFLANVRNYIVFFLSSMVSVAVVFTFIAVWEMLSEFREEKVFLAGRGAAQIVMDAVWITGVLTVFLMIFAMKFYVCTRMRDYAAYELLGVSGRDTGKLKAAEYIGSNVFAFAFGLLFGNLLSIVCKELLESFFFQRTLSYVPGAGTYVYTGLISIVIFWMSFVINTEVSVETNIIRNLTGEALREKRPVKKSRQALLGAGILLSVFGILYYREPRTVEAMHSLFVFLLGMCVIIYYGGSILLDAERKRERFSGKGLLYLQRFYYQYRSNVIYIILLFVLQFLTMFYYPVQLAANMPVRSGAEEYPYDFIWKMDRNREDEQELLKNLKTEYDAECKVVPAAVVTVPFGDNTDTHVDNLYNQGQNIAIPESVYTMFTGKKLKLAEKEIVVVLQQGKERAVHPLDFYWYGETYLHFGPAHTEFVDGFKIPTMQFTKEYHVREIRRENLIGQFGSGRCENIVVFSDGVFEDIEQMKGLEELLYYEVDGQDAVLRREDGYVPGEAEKSGFVNRLVLMNVPEKQKDEVHRLLEEKYPAEEARGYDGDVRRYYDSRDAKKELYAGRILETVIYSMIYGVFIFTNLFIIFVKVYSDRDLMQEESKFYHIFGMRKKKRKKVLFCRFRMMFLVSSGLAFVCGGFFTALTLYMRRFTAAETIQFVKTDIFLAGGALVIQFLAFQIAKIHTWRRLER